MQTDSGFGWSVFDTSNMKSSLFVISKLCALCGSKCLSLSLSWCSSLANHWVLSGGISLVYFSGVFYSHLQWFATRIASKASV